MRDVVGDKKDNRQGECAPRERLVGKLFCVGGVHVKGNLSPSGPRFPGFSCAASISIAKFQNVNFGDVPGRSPNYS
jgi:hypothetical protein